MKKILLAIIIALFLLGCSNEPSKRDLLAYSGWCKLNNRTDITYEELVAMKRAGILPGVQKRSNNTDYINGAITGAVVGASINSGRR